MSKKKSRQENSSQNCPHMKYISPLQDQKFSNYYFQERLRNQQLKCLNCDYLGFQDIWICLSEKCFGIYCNAHELNNRISIYSKESHVMHHYQEISSNLVENFQNNQKLQHSIYINPFSLQIICLECKSEIFDFEQINMTGNEAQFKGWNNPLKIRELFIDESTKAQKQNLILTQLENPQSHWKNNKGICGLNNLGNTDAINSTLQIIINIPSVKKILKRYFKSFHLSYEDSEMINNLELQAQFFTNVNQKIDKILPRSISKKLIFYLAELIDVCWSGKVRAFKPQDLLNYIYKKEPSFRGYGPKEPFILFKQIMNWIHYEFYQLSSKQMDIYSPIKCFDQYPPDDWEQIKGLKKYEDMSFITDTFKGQLMVTVKCQQCHTLQYQNESFLALSMQVPQQGDIELVGNFGLEKQSIDRMVSQICQAYQLKSSQDPSTQLSKLKYNLQYNQINLTTFYECLIKFCQSEIIVHQQSHFCNQCNQNVACSKILSFDHLPNILCVQLQNDSQDGTLKLQYPIKDLDMNTFIQNKTKQNSQSNIYDLLGVIEKVQNEEGRFRYRSIIKNYKYNKFYLYDDTEVTQIDEKALLEKVPYILFYKMQITQNQKLRQNIKSQVNLMKSKEIVLQKKECSVLPQFWYEKFMTLQNPGMIRTINYLCTHGLLKPHYYDVISINDNISRNQQQRIQQNIWFNDVSVLNETGIQDLSMTMNKNYIDQSIVQNENEDYFNADNEEDSWAYQNLQISGVCIPLEIGRYLRELYGGSLLIQGDISLCPLCLSQSKALIDRRKQEIELINKYDRKQSTSVYYMISEKWITIWKEYLYSSKKVMKKGFVKGLTMPGKIDNSNLLISDKEPKTNLEIDSDYRVVSLYIWKILQNLYGGGPVIARVSQDIHSKPAIEPSYELPQSDLDIIKNLKQMVAKSQEVTHENQQ